MPQSKSMSVFILARSLDVGGAERQLILLAKGLRRRGHSVQVGLFYSGGSLLPELDGSGVEVVDLGKRGRWDWPRFMRTLVAELRRRRPDVLYSFLPGPNVVAAAARPLIPRTRLVWSVRASDMNLAEYGPVERLARKLESALSRTPDVIIANSSAGAAHAVRNGFPAGRIIVVPNGIDTDRFRPDAELRRKQRSALGLKKDQIAVGVLARLDPMKGYRTFLEAAAIVAPREARVRFLCIGDGPERRGLEARADELGLGEQVVFTGELDPVAALNALDIACSSSLWGEGFSNAVAEAMACGLACIVTDAGDSAAIVGSLGTVVPAGSATALADAITAEVAKLPSHDPAGPRQRIVEQFSVDAMVDATVAVFRSSTRREIA